jgi:hypothetical protein
LRQDGTGTGMDITQDDRRTGDLRLGLVCEQLIEAHGGLTVLRPAQALADPGGHRLRAPGRTRHSGPVRPDD